MSHDVARGLVCERHRQWCPDGTCPYCEPATDAELKIRIAHGLRMLGFDADAALMDFSMMKFA